MSLLDDVSIVVTPNGYKAGELYAVIPVPTEGADEIVDGNFPDGSTAWALNGWTISGNAANCSGITANMIQNISGSTNKQFLITFTISNYISGSVRPAFVGGYGYSSAYNANGVYTTVISSYSDIRFVFYSNSFNGSISNVSVKEYTSADMDVTRETAATRVDENGLVNYAEVLGGNIYDGNINSAVNGGTWTDNSDGTFTVTGVGSPSVGVGVRDTVAEYLTDGKTYKWSADGSNITLAVYNSGYGLVASGTSTLYFTATAVNRLYMSPTDGVSATYSNVSVKEVTRDNVPRIDYTGGGCPHILAEPQRTNLVPYSEDFSNADWGNASLGTTPVLTSGFTSPDGTDNAYKISNANQNSMWLSATLIGASDSRTIYARTVSGTGTAQLLSHNSNTNNTFNLTEEWQRFEVSTTTSGTGATSYYAVDFRGSGTLNELLIWGAQAEVGSYPTSYIPNFGTALGVTRNQDIFTRDGIGSLINSTEGVLFLEMAALSDDSDSKRITISDGTLTNRITISIASNIISGFINVNNVTQYTFYESGITTTDFNKIAIKYKVNDFAIWINGVEYDVDTSGITFSADTLNTLNFSNATNLSNFFNGKVKQLQVYDTALTDEQLLQLTGESGTDFYESYAEMASALTYTIQ